MNTTVVRCQNCGKRNRVPAAAGTGTPRCGNCHAPLPWVADADDGSFVEVAERSPIPVMLDLWAPWCGPCRMVSPALERLAEQFAGRVKLVKVNVDVAPETAQRFQAQSIPTLIVLRDGDVVARQIGATGEAQLRAWLEQALASIGSGTPTQR